MVYEFFFCGDDVWCMNFFSMVMMYVYDFFYGV